MAVEFEDHRRFTAEKAAEAAKKMQENADKVALMVQAPSTQEVGDERLDKMVRHIQAKIDEHTPQMNDAAHKGMGAIKEEVSRICQLQYMFTKGMITAYEEMQKMPVQILSEERGQPTH